MYNVIPSSDIFPCQVIILDVRVPSVPVARLCNHRAQINGITWAPHSSCHICTAGEECSIGWEVEGWEGEGWEVEGWEGEGWEVEGWEGRGVGG